MLSHDAVRANNLVAPFLCFVETQNCSSEHWFVLMGLFLGFLSICYYPGDIHCNEEHRFVLLGLWSRVGSLLPSPLPCGWPDDGCLLDHVKGGQTGNCSHSLWTIWDASSKLDLKGGTCCFADKNALRGTLLENIKHFRPSRLQLQLIIFQWKSFCHLGHFDRDIARFVGVPRVFEKIEEGMKAAGAKSGLKKKVTRKYENRLYDEKQRILPRKSGLGLEKKVRKCLLAAYSSDKT